ncbi:MAG: hypothetical protein QGH39_07455 [Candidatus Thermoplasmatota archaeon]|nr:hypothetical protein [Candidatus Thermoplasmatota archaeon]
MVFVPSNAEAAMDYDLHYYDPFGDIQLVAQEGHFVTGSQWDDLDITEITSSSDTTGIGPTQITLIELTITVKGSIDEDENIYAVFISADSVEYSIAYKDKKSIGFNMDNEEPIFASAAVFGSSITFSIDEKQLGSPTQNFKWNAMAIQRADDGNYGDIAPNKLVKITEPWDRSIVYGSITIEGVTRSSTVTYEKVEIQIDSKSGSGWSGTTDKGGWKNWEYNLDTTLLADGEHSIYVRATDSDSSVHSDEITISIHQDSKDNPVSTEVKPNPHIGDRYMFTISEASSDAPEMINIDISTTSDMEATMVGGNEKINSFDCWKMVTSQSGELSLGGVNFNFETEGEVYLEDDNFDIVKEDSNVEITGELIAPQKQHKVTEYTPPKIHYEFPIEVSKEWYANTKASINLDGVVSTEDLSIEYRCLFNSKTTFVPGGDFETYAIRSQNDDASFYKVEYYSPKIGYPVRIETFDIDDRLIGVLVLSDYDIKDTLIEFSGNVELVTGNDESKVYESDEIDFKITVINSGIGKAENALVIGYYKGAGSSEEKMEFAREGVELKPQSEKTVTLSLQINESGTYEVSFRSLSDKADSVYDDEKDYAEEITVLRNNENGGSISTISTNTYIVGGAGIVIAIIIIIVLVTRKKKETSEFQFVTVEAVGNDSSIYEEDPVEVEMAEVIIEPDDETGDEEGEKEYQCPACEVELSGDELECPECKVVFEEFLAGIEEENPSVADELLGETVAEE